VLSKATTPTNHQNLASAIRAVVGANEVDVTAVVEAIAQMTVIQHRAQMQN
jgi:hypothetical protein